MFRLILISNMLFLCYVIACPISPESSQIEIYKRNSAVKRLQEYIQIDTRDGANSEQVVAFWSRQATELGVPIAVYRPAGLPICVLTLRGSNPDLPSFMLNHHADVVPVEEKQWNYPAFSGYIAEDGKLYGRGTQDTKAVGIQYLEAIRKLLENNITLERTLHMTVMPDEETGGDNGMESFVETDEFKALNIGFALDEGLTSEINELYATYQDKRPWQVQFTIRGEAGHGSVMQRGVAAEKLQTLVNLVMDYRNEQMAIMNSTDKFNVGAYTAVNLNIVEGGIAPNVVPSVIKVVIDMRLATSAEPADVEAMLNGWLSKVGGNSTFEFLRRTVNSPPTSVDDSNPFWVAMRETMQDLNIPFKAIVLGPTSDMVSVREKGIPAFGFSSRRNMASTIHGHDEFITIDNFLEGIDIYVELLKRLGNIPEQPVK